MDNKIHPIVREAGDLRQAKALDILSQVDTCTRCGEPMAVGYADDGFDVCCLRCKTHFDVFEDGVAI